MSVYSDEELERTLDDLESDLVERKESFRGDVPKKARQAVCAFSNDLPFDLHPVPEASLNDLSKVLFESEYLPAAFAPEILEANNRTYEERLASCRMIVSPDNPVPTLVGILALGKRPRAFFPGASVQFLRIDGEELADPVIDEENVDGPLREMLSKIGQKLSAHNRVFVDIVSSPTEKRTYDYPPPALQQLLYNAVLHRTYEKTNTPVRIYWFNDRIEIISQGGPYGNVTRENFGRPGITDYRNPNLAEVMKVFGFVQAFGRGIAVARRALEANGSSPLEFEVDRSAVKAVVHKHPKKDV